MSIACVFVQPFTPCMGQCIGYKDKSSPRKHRSIFRKLKTFNIYLAQHVGQHSVCLAVADSLLESAATTAYNNNNQCTRTMECGATMPNYAAQRMAKILPSTVEAIWVRGRPRQIGGHSLHLQIDDGHHHRRHSGQQRLCTLTRPNYGKSSAPICVVVATRKTYFDNCPFCNDNNFWPKAMLHGKKLVAPENGWRPRDEIALAPTNCCLAQLMPIG